MIVESPKTEHHEGKDRREVPIFPNLKPYLEDAWERAEPGFEYVIGGNYRIAAQGPTGWRNCNLRSQFERLVEKAGLEPWPRLFHSMRGSRETELMREHPIHVVTGWLGNSPQIALKHYLSITDDDFARAIGRGTNSGTASARGESHGFAISFSSH